MKSWGFRAAAAWYIAAVVASAFLLTLGEWKIVAAILPPLTLLMYMMWRGEQKKK